MKDFLLAFGLLAWGFHFVCGIQVSSINCGNVCLAVTGKPYTLTCMYSGALTTGITWSRDTITILSCDAGGTCYPTISGYSSGNYPNSSSAALTITSYDRTTDSGTWQCSDGFDTPVRCSLPDPAKGTLQGNCVKNGKSSIIQCLGLTSHGSPAVNLTLKEDTTDLESTSTAGSVNVTHTNADGKTFTCEVTGEAALCLSDTSLSVTCEECICQCSCNSKTRNGAFLGVAVVVLIFWIIFLILLILNFKCSSKARSRESASRGRTGDPTSRGRTGDPTSRGCTASRRSSCASTSSDCSDNRKLKVIICIVILVIFLIIGIVFAVVIGVCPTVRNEIEVSGQECCCSSCEPNGNKEKKESESVEIAALVCCILWIILIVVVVIVVIVKCKKVIVSVVCSNSVNETTKGKTGNGENMSLTENKNQPKSDNNETVDACNKVKPAEGSKPPKSTLATDNDNKTTSGASNDNTTENNSK